jgi:hypothetical protein
MILCTCVMTSSSLMKVISSGVHMHSCNKLRTAGWVFITFVMDVMPFEADPKLYFLLSCNW